MVEVEGEEGREGAVDEERGGVLLEGAVAAPADADDEEEENWENWEAKCLKHAQLPLT